MRRLILFLACATSLCAQGWYSVGGTWSNRKAITIDHTKVIASLSNFPVLFSVVDANIAALAQASGNDILITSGDGLTKLNHEIESYTSGSGTLVAWVNLPTISATLDTTFYIYYGNATATNQQNVTGVWDANYKTVWHLNSVASATDSTTNGNTLTNHSATSTTGKIGLGAAFNGSNQSMSSSATVDLTGNTATVETWANLSSVAACKVILETSTNFNTNTGALIWDPDCEAGGTMGFIVHGAGTNLNYNGLRVENPSASAWHHLAMVVSLGVGAQPAVTAYMDGVVVSSTSAGTANLSSTGFGNWALYLMSRANASLFQGGILDELRVSNTNRSAAWIGTEYNNQNSPSTFYGVGAQENQSSGTTVVSSAPDSGLSILIDGTPCPTPCSPGWTAGTSHTIAAADQTLTGAQYTFASWSDSGAASHSVTAISGAVSYVASFTVQYQLTTATGTGGTISPATAYYAAGTVVSVSVAATAGNAFAGFSGALTGTTTPQTLTMNAPASVTASFTAQQGLSNSVTIYEANGTTQTARPVSIARWFAQGELANFACPYTGGAPISPWQADVKNRWADGSVQFAIVSFTQTLPANGSVMVEFRNCAAASSSPGNTGLTPAQVLAFNGAGWGGKIETTTSGVVASADARGMLTSLAAAPDQLRCWLCGPVVTQMIVEDRTAARAYDWGYQGTPIEFPNGVADAATSTITKTAHGLVNGKTVYLDFTAGTPGGLALGTLYYVVNATANTFQLSLTNGGSPILLTTGASGVWVMQTYATTTWSASTHKSNHPAFVLTAYAGWPGVRLEYIVENAWTDALQDQYFGSVKLYSGAAETTVATNMNNFVQGSRTRWRKICWDGTAPAGEPTCGTDIAVISPRPRGIQVDYNLPYMVYAGEAPPLDTTLTDTTQRAGKITTYYACLASPCDSRDDTTRGDVEALSTRSAGATQGTQHSGGFLHADVYQTGVDFQGLIGYLPSYQAMLLYVMGDTTQTVTARQHMAEVAIDSSYAQAYWPIHYREANTSKKLLSPYVEPGQTTLAFGKPVSVDARPTFVTELPQVSWTLTTDKIMPVGLVRSHCGGGGDMNALWVGSGQLWNTGGGCYGNQKYGDWSEFNTQSAHQSAPIWTSYLLMGDWYASEDLMLWGAWETTLGNTGMTLSIFNGSFARHGSWSIFTHPSDFRARGWSMRTLGYGLLATPTEDPVSAPFRSYLTQKYVLNLYIFEGLQNNQAGSFAHDYPLFANWSCTGWNNTAKTLPSNLDANDPANAWCAGRMDHADNYSNPLGYLNWGGTGGIDCAYINCTTASAMDPLWNWNYTFATWGNHRLLGVVPQLDYFLPRMNQLLIEMSTPEKGYNPIIMSAYRFATFAGTTTPSITFSGPFQTWTDAKNGLVPTYANAATFRVAAGGGTSEFGDSTNQAEHSYAMMARASVALAEYSPGGTRAWDWWVANPMWMQNQGAPGLVLSGVNLDPRYAWIPQWVRNVRVIPATTTAQILWSTFSGDYCRVGVATTPFGSTDSTADATVTLAGRSGSYTATGLTSGTSYYYRVTCGPRGGTARATGSFTTR